MPADIAAMGSSPMPETAETGPRFHALQADLAKALAAQAVASVGIDILVNNAGIIRRAAIANPV